jgi:hypothetical protein
MVSLLAILVDNFHRTAEGLTTTPFQNSLAERAGLLERFQALLLRRILSLDPLRDVLAHKIADASPFFARDALQGFALSAL